MHTKRTSAGLLLASRQRPFSRLRTLFIFVHKYEGMFESSPHGKKIVRGEGYIACGNAFRHGYPCKQNRLWLTSEPIFYLRANKKERFVPSPLCQKERNLNRTVFDLGFFWRRGRDSNPRGFWPNGFQDRLVMTASIPLQIYTSILYAYICRDCIETARKFICESAAYARTKSSGNLLTRDCPQHKTQF